MKEKSDNNKKVTAFVKISNLILSIEKQMSCSSIDYENENTDVIVKLEDGAKYIASFFTYKNVKSLNLEHQRSGEFLNGKYFWLNNFVLIENCSKESITKVVEYLIDEGEFSQVFQKL